MTSLTNTLVQSLTADHDDVGKLIDAQAVAFDYLQHYGTILNFDKKVVEVVETTIESYLDLMKKQQSIAQLIQQVVNRRASINFQGFYLTCLLIHHIFKQLQRYQEPRMQKLIMAALFCDLGLERSEVYLIYSNTELLKVSDSGVLSEQEIELVRAHARRNAEVLRNYPDLPLEVITLIRQHHGSPDGIGFHDQDNPQIQEDSLILMATHTFVKYFITPTFKFDKKEILRQLRERFPFDRIRPYWDAIGAKIE